MDTVSHVAMGAVFAVALAPRLIGAQTVDLETRRRLALVGAIGGILPDADTLIQSSSDALLVLEYHRHFTHSLAFAPLGALLVVALLWPLWRSRLGFRPMFVASLVGYLAHLLLDACTSYGIHLGLPFSSAQTAWSVIAVFDPSFTALLLVPLFLSLRRYASRAARWALPLALIYLAVAGFQKLRVEATMNALVQARGHSAAMVSTKPTLANLILWRSVYAHEGRVYADAIRAGLAVKLYEGTAAEIFGTGEAMATAGEENRLRDIERFRVLSQGFMVRDPRRADTLGDARYAMLPTDIAPLWGIRWNPSTARTEFVSQRDMSPAMRQQFLDMLLGRERGYGEPYSTPAR